MKNLHLVLLMAIILFPSCKSEKMQDKIDLGTDFKEYWYKGKAEITSYDLQQARYGETHEGHAVLIFVTEDISKTEQVKLDDPSAAGEDKINVLKLNYIKKFNTGIYPYSMMMSVFSPVQLYSHPRPLKISMSVQEWCGHVFTQLNLKNDDYHVQQYSYFQSEGDKDFELDADVFTEDELWNRIRIDFRSLPQGQIEIIPGVLTSRLLHYDLKSIMAEAELVEIENDIMEYTLNYSKDHVIKVQFNKLFPHEVIRWKETVKDLTGKISTTTAERKETLITEYWEKNKNEFLFLRDTLGLE